MAPITTNVPTTVTVQSATLIDHIYSNNYANILTYVIPDIGLSDHFQFLLVEKQMHSSAQGLAADSYLHLLQLN